VTGVRLAINRLEAGDDGRVGAVPTGEEEVLECGLVLRSIGYRGEPLAGIPFDERRGLVRNLGGRVCEADGEPCRGEYVVGWIKRGPTGVIGTNKKDAADTVARILEDRDAGLLGAPQDGSAEHVETWLAEQVPHAVTWAGWEAIDRHETGAGEPHGRPRVKLVRLEDMRGVALSRSAASPSGARAARTP
jgi:ferredoxin--NADP+ reductase